MAKEVILPEFQAFLRSRKLVPEKNISFYAYWAHRFLAFCNKTPVSDQKNAIMNFGELLKKDPGIAEWQCRQADGGAFIYF